MENTIENTLYEWKSVRVSCQDVDDILALHRELSPNAKPFFQSDLRCLMVTGYLLVARDQTTFRTDGKEKIIGMATLAPEYTLNGVFGFIEDVIVDKEHRERGIGRALNLLLIEKARELGIKWLQLTSRPSRKPANKMYRKLGYQLVARARYPRAKYPNDTNLYRLELA